MLRRLLKCIIKSQKFSFWDKEICPVVRVEFLGRSVLFLVDSGSDTSYLDRDFFLSTNYDGEIKASKGVIGPHGEDSSYGKILVNITLGEYKYELPMTVYKLKERMVYLGNTSEEHPVGIIGADFLQMYHMVIDFKGRVLYEHI